MSIRSKFRLALLAGLSVSAFSALNAAYVAADFSTYTDGALVGQNGWVQYNTQATNALSVSSGSVSFSSGSPTNDQDAFLAFPAQIAQPVSGTTTFYVGLKISIGSAVAASPSYFAALNTLTTSTTSGNFQNARLVALASGAGFVFGTRVNGQTGYPFVYGSTVLSFDTEYTLIAKVNMVSGNANDSIQLYVVPSAESLDFDAVYANAVYTTGTVADPLYGALLLSQFGSVASPQSEVSLSSVMVTDSESEILSFGAIPEPSSAACLAGLGALGFTALRRRRR